MYLIYNIQGYLSERNNDPNGVSNKRGKGSKRTYDMNNLRIHWNESEVANMSNSQYLVIRWFCSSIPL